MRYRKCFGGQISLADQQKAADYSVARARLGRWATLTEAVVKLLFTLGGGIAIVDALWRQTGLAEPWRGTLIVCLAALLLLHYVGLPFAFWKTFKVAARFGFNRLRLGLFAEDYAKRLLLGALLGGPLLLSILVLMQRAGSWWWVWVWCLWLIWTLGLSWAAPVPARRCSINFHPSPIRP